MTRLSVCLSVCRTAYCSMCLICNQNGWFYAAAAIQLIVVGGPSGLTECRSSVIARLCANCPSCVLPPSPSVLPGLLSADVVLRIIAGRRQ